MATQEQDYKPSTWTHATTGAERYVASVADETAARWDGFAPAKPADERAVAANAEATAKANARQDQQVAKAAGVTQ